MPRHLISDAHEWINEIPTVPIYYLAKPQPRERAWQNQRGKKTLLPSGTTHAQWGLQSPHSRVAPSSGLATARCPVWRMPQTANPEVAFSSYSNARQDIAGLIETGSGTC